MNRYGLTDAQLYDLFRACGRRVCGEHEHFGCPYWQDVSESGKPGCEQMLAEDMGEMVLRLLTGEIDDSCSRCGREDCTARGEGYTIPCPVLERPEMTMEWEADILQRAVDAYGAAAQTDLMLEEMSELAKELLKLRRAKSEQEAEAICKNIREEMADVQIVLNQMCLIYGDFNEEEIAKLERLDKRLKEAGA